MIAELRQPLIGSVTGLRSGVMKRPLSGSESIAVLGPMSEARHCRRISRSVSMPGQSDFGSATPGLSGGIILSLSNNAGLLLGRMAGRRVLHFLLSFRQSNGGLHELAPLQRPRPRRSQDLRRAQIGRAHV